MIVKSPSPEVEIPNVSWPEYFLQRIRPYHEQIALIDGETGRQISFDELRENIYSLAIALQQKGYQQGDVFAIYAPNLVDYVSVFQAILLTGGIVTTANPLYIANELAHQLKHAQALGLFTTTDLLTKVEQAQENT